MTGELVLTKAMSTVIVLAFFAVVIFFLRFLYGPKGVFRDPKWDKWNEEARMELEAKARRKESERAFQLFAARFREYASGFYTGDEAEDYPLKVKEDHSFRVYALALRIAGAEAAFAGPLTAKGIGLAALFHDVARFHQYRTYHTFWDDVSLNHGAEGARIIYQQGFLASEEAALRRLVLAAVSLHNRKAVPPRLGGATRIVLQGLRDADKLDILRVLANTLEGDSRDNDVVLMHLSDEPALYSPNVLVDLEAGRQASYRDMRYYNDFRILLISWLFDLGFAESRRIAREEGHMLRLVKGLAGIPEVQAKVEAIVTKVFSQ
ncbi:HD domain-containing protein [Desulfovibrio sp. OttesenSCG-928-G15]|nr:HD domain-containing protein [Desulfovibrio sp. OttesenSCG-928-G15]